MIKFYSYLINFLCLFLLLSCAPKAKDQDYKQVVNGYNSTLSAYWKMDEASGARSSSVNVSTLSSTSAPTSGDGLMNKASLFSSTLSQYLKVEGSSAPALQFTSRFAVSLWINPTSAPASSSTVRVVFNKQAAGGQDNVVISYNSNTLYASLRTQSGGVVTIGTQYIMNIGRWTHLMFAGQGQLVKLYVNGLQVDYGSAYANLDTTIGDAYIGAGSASDRFFDGLIDEVAVWKDIDFANTQSMDALAEALYNEGRGISAN